MEITPLFSKPILTTKIHLLDSEYSIIDEVFKNNNVNILSNNKKVLEDNKLIFLKNNILNVVNEYWLKTLRYDVKLQLTTSWFTRLNKGHFSNWHKHSNNLLSGVFYFGNHFSKIKFKNFVHGNSYDIKPLERNIYNSDDWYIEPEKGLLIVFPSEIYHKIEDTEFERTSMAFNFIPIGTYGREDSIVNINYKNTI